MKHKNGISLVANNPATRPCFYTFEECEKPARARGGPGDRAARQSVLAAGRAQKAPAGRQEDA